MKLRLYAENRLKNEASVLTGKVLGHPNALVVQLSGVFHPRAKCVLHLCHPAWVDQRLDEALCGASKNTLRRSFLRFKTTMKTETV